FMLGALFTAHWVTNWFPAWGESAWLYALAMLMGAAGRRLFKRRPARRSRAKPAPSGRRAAPAMASVAATQSSQTVKSAAGTRGVR
ncbi:MAG: hypothetical protein EOO54_30405, partial [Haliea sp.]